MDKTGNYLTTGEVAAQLGWSHRVIDHLVRAEKLPNLTINGELRFDRSELIGWFEEKIRTLDHPQVVALDNQISGRDPEHEESDPVTAQLTKQGIRWDVLSADKQSLLGSLADFALETGVITDHSVLLNSLIEREQLCSTALPGGVAICHPRDPLPEIVTKPFIRLIRTTTSIAFGAEDLKPTQIFFLIVAAADRGHLQTLARLARILDDDTRAALLAARSAATAYKLIAERELTIHRRRHAMLAQSPDENVMGDGI
jgi:PTS system nitrogen regulatory IIA component